MAKACRADGAGKIKMSQRIFISIWRKISSLPPEMLLYRRAFADSSLCPS
ncbi:hypothetical protein CAter282_2692 [Collimonas arenae]|uniref:Uncharacterized protein n=1 Tax=Collimonas arenae TaxID=279058 RepID=A0A127PT41_9BURK|nr:hypothetical protein CAter10_2966 [Collimonas arenae]AMP10422.1 hypothetical protein CAter282_2692 [Collimonas arenae]